MGDIMNTKKLIYDKTLAILIFFLLIISLLSIYSASIYLSKSLGNLVLKQLFWYILGIITILIIAKLKVSFFLKLAPYLYIITNILLLGLLFFAPEINGSKCWYVINGIGSFQPSEFMKITLILMEVYIIDKFKTKYKTPTISQELKLITLIIITFLIPSILTFLEPDTGSIIIYFMITFIILLTSGIRLRWFFGIGIFILLLLGLFFCIYFFKQDLFINIFGSDFFYRIDRIINWRNGSGMQLENSLVAIASSGILGHGFNKTPIYFPEAGTDFIFTVFASNFGLIGSLSLIVIILFFDLHIIRIGIDSKDDSNKYIIAGIIAIIFYQQVQNISMTIGLLPITGITLPFISYGGSSLLSYMILVGFCMQIYVENDKKKRLSSLYN